jgi:RNA polymerase sigma factor (sigma-70 family)
MVRAVRALRNGSRPETPGPWLHRITRNCALDLTASRRRHPVVELADHAHPPAEDAQEAVERRMGVRGLVDDVGRLPDTQRSALVLRELEGRSYADIADELEVTVPAVKSLLVRARQGLKRARDDRRVAAWLPLPLLGRLLERLTTAWEPVAATATPKVACAAVVVAGSLPMIAGPSAQAPPVHRHVSHDGPAVTAVAPASARPAVAQAAGPAIVAPKGKLAGSVSATSAVGAGAAPAASAADIAAALHADCTDGAIDGTYARSVLFKALDASQQGAEYGDCRQALLTATLIKG